MRNLYKNVVFTLVASLVTTFTFAQDYSNGIFILNEGLIGTPSASVSFLDSSGTLENNIFSNNNSNMDLGDTGQGMGLTEDYVYVVLNNSNEVKVINRTNFEFVTNITAQLAYPRYIAFYEGNGYVTNWGDPGNPNDDYIAIIDLATNMVTGTIPVAEGTEEILQQNGKLFVAHQGGYGFGNTISVIDITTSVVEVIQVADVPSSLKIDENNLYVLCSGKPDWTGDETIAKLYKIDLLDFQNTTEFTFEATEHPEFLGLDETALYYVLNKNIYKMNLSDVLLPSAPFIDTTPNNIQLPYGFNKIEDKLYLADGIDYVSDGKVFVFGEDGSSITDYTVGPLPNGFYKFEESTASTPDFATTNIAIYPNPASESFKLNTSENADIIIYDLSGRLIKTAQYANEAISLAGLKVGVYLVQIKMNNKTSTQKLIIQ